MSNETINTDELIEEINKDRKRILNDVESLNETIQRQAYNIDVLNALGFGEYARQEAIKRDDEIASRNLLRDTADSLARAINALDPNFKLD